MISYARNAYAALSAASLKVGLRATRETGEGRFVQSFGKVSHLRSLAMRARLLARYLRSFHRSSYYAIVGRHGFHSAGNLLGKFTAVERDSGRVNEIKSKTNLLPALKGSGPRAGYHPSISREAHAAFAQTFPQTFYSPTITRRMISFRESAPGVIYQLCHSRIEILFKRVGLQNRQIWMTLDARGKKAQ